MRKYSSAGREDRGGQRADARRRAGPGRGTRGRVLPDSMRGTGRRAGGGSAMAGRGAGGRERAEPSGAERVGRAEA